jgi:hypothetical protein
LSFETVLDALDEQGLVSGPRGWDGSQKFLCPAHRDRQASGNLSEGDDGRALVYCHAGCETEDIVEALGLTMGDLFVDEAEKLGSGRDAERNIYYEYTDAAGNPLYRVVRFTPKGFTQERYEEGRFRPGLNGVRRVLYNLPEVLGSDLVYVVEGEKDVERLRAEGVVATCNVGGAGKWRPEWSESLRGKDVIIVPDRDGPGEKHAHAIQAALDGVARSARLAYPASGKDVSDHLDAGYSLSQLRGEPDASETFEPLDWENYEAPATEWLYHPYIPTRGRVLVFGKAGSLKSLWVMWIATRLARQGKRVAYFSLEMRPEQTVARLKKLAPPKENFKVFTNYRMGDPDYLRRTVEALKGFDLIVIDSWNAAYRFTAKGSHDDQVAELDDLYFGPIIDGTGASLVIIDNTGHDVVVGFGSKIQSQHARGSSAKGDKMDVTIFLTRPDEGNNYLTEVHVKKMRYDIPIPAKRLVVAPSEHDSIEFYNADSLGQRLSSAWDVEDEAINGLSNGERAGALESDSHNRPSEPEGHETGNVREMAQDDGGVSQTEEVVTDEMSNAKEDMGVADQVRGRVPPQRVGKEGMGPVHGSVLQTDGMVDVPDAGEDRGMATPERELLPRESGGMGSLHEGLLQTEGTPIEEEVTDADEPEQDPFAGWKPSEKLAFLKAQRLFKELGTDEQERS